MTLLKLGPTIITPEFTPKNWGYERTFDNNPGYCGKLLVFAAGKRCSVHMHKLKTETFLLYKGRMDIFYHDDAPALEALWKEKQDLALLYNVMERVQMTQGSVFKVPVGRVHQMVALEDSELFEFSTQHFESDSYRIVKGD